MTKCEIFVHSAPTEWNLRLGSHQNWWTVADWRRKLGLSNMATEWIKTKNTQIGKCYVQGLCHLGFDGFLATHHSWEEGSRECLKNLKKVIVEIFKGYWSILWNKIIWSPLIEKLGVATDFWYQGFWNSQFGRVMSMQKFIGQGQLPYSHQ